MSKLHVFNLNTDTCESCGISHKEMIDTQAMNYCPRDKFERYFDASISVEPVYIKARMKENTMEVEVADRGIWIPLDTYHRQRRLNEKELGDVMIDGEPVVIKDEKPILPKHIYGKITIPRDRFTDEQFAAIKQMVTKEQKKNYCKPSDVLSRCKAGKGWKEQQKCRFSEKATRAEKCMYFRDFNDVEHCDCVDAQREPYLSTD